MSAPGPRRGVSGGELAAVAVALLLAALLYGAISVLSRPGPLADLTHYKHWAWLVTVEGMHAAYSGSYPETYAIYPPVTLLPFWLAGEVYRAFVDPSFDQTRMLDSHALTVLLRLQAVLFHLLVGVAVYGVVRRAARGGPALLALVAYLFNPGVLFDVAQWGQPDPVFGLFVVLALAAVAWPLADPLPRSPMGSLRPGPLLCASIAGAAIVLGALAKPQAWVYLPLAALLVWRRAGLLGALASGLAGGAAFLLVALPYLQNGTLRELAGLPRAISSVMPNVSANAHNVWWVATRGDARWLLDEDLFVGALPYRLVAVGLLGLCAGLALLRAWREPTLAVVFASAAYTALAFFMVMTQIHENHMYVVFPLLAVAAALDRRLWPLYVVLALTWCANMVLHDFDIAEQFVAPWLPGPLNQVHWVNSLLNTLVFVAWTVWLLADTARAWLGPATTPLAARVRA